MNRILLIDAGNTRIKWAVAAGARESSWRADAPAWLAQGVIDHGDAAHWAEQLAACLPTPPAGVWLSNVAGEALERVVRSALSACWSEPPALHAIRAQASQLGIVNHYATPVQLGSDRWASLIGARAAYPGEALLIATLGTATTLESLTADGHFLGGLIAPGLRLMLESLAQGTAQLPAVAAHADDSAPFANDTHRAIAAGCLAAQAGLVERSHAALGRRVGNSVRCIITGGARHLLMPHLAVPYTEHDNLVLAGLCEIARAGLHAVSEGMQ